MKMLDAWELVLIMLMLKGYRVWKKVFYCHERQIARNVYRLISGFIIFEFHTYICLIKSFFSILLSPISYV